MASDAVQFLSQPPARIQEELTHIKILFIANLMAEPESTNVAQDVLFLTDMPADVLNDIAVQAENEVHQLAKTLNLVWVRRKKDIIFWQMILRDVSMFFGTLDNLPQGKGCKNGSGDNPAGVGDHFPIPPDLLFSRGQKKESAHRDLRKRGPPLQTSSQA